MYKVQLRDTNLNLLKKATLSESEVLALIADTLHNTGTPIKIINVVPARRSAR